MTAGVHDPATAAPLRPAGAAAVAYGALTVVSAVVQAALVDFAVASPADLIEDVARHQAWWVGAQTVLIAQQLLLLPAALGLLAALARSSPRSSGTQSPTSSDAAVVLLGAAAGSYVMSGIFHGVLGVHIDAFDTLSGTERATALHLAEVVHALGDTCYFVAVALTAVAMVAVSPTLRRSPAFPRRLATLGLVTAVCEAAQFGWFLAPSLGYAAPLGLSLQAAWFCWLGRCLERSPVEVPAIP